MFCSAINKASFAAVAYISQVGDEVADVPGGQA
jgi:hypothetical protein